MPDFTLWNFAPVVKLRTSSAFGIAVVALGMAVSLPLHAASASEVSTYTCSGEGDVFYEATVSWVDGNSKALIGPRSEYYTAADVAAQTETALETPSGSGFRFDSRSYTLFGKGSDVRLSFQDYPNETPLPCIEEASSRTQAPVVASARKSVPAYITARSLGGRLRTGPGTNYPAAGSLAEGAPVTIILSTDVTYDGYDWFQIRNGGGVAYQWGGIMCYEGRPIPGMYGDCGAVLGGQDVLPPPVQNASSGQGWMAFAISRSGRIGHGAAATRREAENYAMQYCGEASCRVEDVTQARCHAAATGSSGHWFGAAQTKQAAESFAMGFCTNGGSGCAVQYSFCR